MVSDRRKYSFEASVKVSSRSNFSNCVYVQNLSLIKGVTYRHPQIHLHISQSKIIELDNLQALHISPQIIYDKSRCKLCLNPRSLKVVSFSLEVDNDGPEIQEI